jgi:hypothetical protein
LPDYYIQILKRGFVLGKGNINFFEKKVLRELFLSKEDGAGNLNNLGYYVTRNFVTYSGHLVLLE